MEMTFKFTEDNGGNWTISTKDYKELVEALIGHDESGIKAVYTERIHKNLSDYQPEDSSDSSNKLKMKRVITDVAALFYLVISSLIPITFIYHLLGFYY